VPEQKRDLRRDRGERKIGITVYLDPWQVDAFRDHEELKNKRSATVRNILGNYLENNGFNEVDLERQKHVHREVIRKHQLVVSTIEEKQKEIIKIKVMEDEAELLDIKHDLFVAQTIYKLAKEFHLIDYKGEFTGETVSDGERMEWIKKDLRVLRKNHKFDMDAKEMMFKINELRDQKGGEWIEEYRSESQTGKF